MFAVYCNEHYLDGLQSDWFLSGRSIDIDSDIDFNVTINACLHGSIRVDACQNFFYLQCYACDGTW